MDTNIKNDVRDNWHLTSGVESDIGENLVVIKSSYSDIRLDTISTFELFTLYIGITWYWSNPISGIKYFSSTSLSMSVSTFISVPMFLSLSMSMSIVQVHVAWRIRGRYMDTDVDTNMDHHMDINMSQTWSLICHRHGQGHGHGQGPGYGQWSGHR